MFRRQRKVNQSRVAEHDWFSSLHTLARLLSEAQDPQQMAEQVIEQALRMLDASEGYVLVRSPEFEPRDLSGGRGLSPSALGRLARESLRAYLAGSGERWGSLMVFPDLLQPNLSQTWQRDPGFREFLDVFREEKLQTLVVIGLQGKAQSFGALLIGSRAQRVFGQAELRLMLAVGNQISISLENRYLHKVDERHTEGLKLLHRVGEALRASFELREQAEILCRELGNFLGLKNFFLALQDSPGGGLETLIAFDGKDGESRKGAAKRDGFSEYVLRARAPLLVTQDAAGTARRLGIELFDPRIRSWAGVPIPFSDGSLGVLAVADFEREQAIEEGQFKLLQLLAGEAAGAIQNARLLAREQRRARHLTLLNELGREAAAVLHPQELLPGICQRIGGAFGYDLVRIETLDGDRQELVVEAQEGGSSGQIGKRFKLGAGLSGMAAESGEPMRASSVEEGEGCGLLDARVRSALSLPLKYRGDLLGVLSVGSYRENDFSEQDVLTLCTLADQLSVALHNARAFQVAQEQAITDGLTGLKTHRYLMEALESEWKRAPRSGRFFSVIMMDLDGFKEVNDREGHLEGDRVLATVAQVLASRSRQSNVLARYGGDEFVMLVPEASLEQAQVLGERLRQSLEADPHLASRKVTASIGIGTFPVHGATPEEILRVADSGMYLAKHDGGNRVRVASTAGESVTSERERELVEAYLGVTVKRMFSTGPDAFNRYLQTFQKADANGESISLLETVTALAFAIDAKDHYTQGHSQSVSRLAAQIALQLGLPPAEIEQVRLAGILHDIGKIGVPEAVLNKPSRLSDDEFGIMKGHAALGDKILEPLKVKAFERIRPMVRSHHEWVNGRGYPDGLHGEEIPMGARILTVADSFDTMVSQRAYKKERPTDEAIAELRRCAGAQFDARVVETFVQSLQALGDPRLRTAFEKVAN